MFPLPDNMSVNLLSHPGRLKIEGSSLGNWTCSCDHSCASNPKVLTKKKGVGESQVFNHQEVQVELRLMVPSSSKGVDFPTKSVDYAIRGKLMSLG